MSEEKDPEATVVTEVEVPPVDTAAYPARPYEQARIR